MSGRRQNIIRTLLRKKAAQGRSMTVAQIVVATGADKRRGTYATRRALYTMPDVYIKEWVMADNGSWAASWSIAVPPPSARRPE